MNRTNPEKQETLYLDCYEAHSDSIFRYCFYKTSDREKALDLTQDVFMKAWEFIQEGNEVRNMKSLLFTMATHLIIDEYRKRKTLSLDRLTEEGLDLKDTTVVDKSLEFDISYIKKMLHTLPEPYRDVIILRYIEDLEVKEIAKILSESENVISVRIHRALGKMRIALEKTEHVQPY